MAKISRIEVTEAMLMNVLKKVGWDSPEDMEKLFQILAKRLNYEIQ